MAKTYRKIPRLSEQDIQRFWSHIDKTPGHGPNKDCWIWKDQTERDGYARLIVKCDKNKWRNFPAHRISFFLHHGSIIDSLCVCHSCDNRCCVNPAHLWQGTMAHNQSDMVRKGRSARGERNSGAKLTPSQVQEIRTLLDSGVGNTVLAKKFGVTKSTITWIRQGGTWKHL